MFILKSNDEGSMEWVPVRTLDKHFINYQDTFRCRVINFEILPDSKFKFNPQIIVKRSAHGFNLHRTMTPASLIISQSMVLNWIILNLAQVKFLAQWNLIKISKKFSTCLDHVTVIPQSVNLQDIVMTADQERQIRQSEEEIQAEMERVSRSVVNEQDIWMSDPVHNLDEVEQQSDLEMLVEDNMVIEEEEEEIATVGLSDPVHNLDEVEQQSDLEMLVEDIVIEEEEEIETVGWSVVYEDVSAQLYHQMQQEKTPHETETDLTGIDNAVMLILSNLPQINDPVMYTTIDVSEQEYQTLYPPMFLEMSMDESWDAPIFSASRTTMSQPCQDLLMDFRRRQIWIPVQNN